MESWSACIDSTLYYQGSGVTLLPENTRGSSSTKILVLGPPSAFHVCLGSQDCVRNIVTSIQNRKLSAYGNISLCPNEFFLFALAISTGLDIQLPTLKTGSFCTELTFLCPKELFSFAVATSIELDIQLPPLKTGSFCTELTYRCQRSFSVLPLQIAPVGYTVGTP